MEFQELMSLMTLYVSAVYIKIIFSVSKWSINLPLDNYQCYQSRLNTKIQIRKTVDQPLKKRKRRLQK